jgi:hypothetical protein
MERLELGNGDHDDAVFAAADHPLDLLEVVDHDLEVLGAEGV